MAVANNWYQIHHPEQLDSPCLVIYPDRMHGNIHLLKDMVNNDIQRLRPHVKTHKTKEVTQAILSAGIRKFKCATISEAEMLGMCNVDDALLAYQPIGPKLERFIALIDRYPGTVFSCLVDNLESAQHISESAIQNNIIIPVYIDLNIGMNRTGVKPGESALQLYEDCVKLPGLNVLGLHAYDGHIAMRDLTDRTRMCNDGFAAVEQMKLTLVEKGYKEPEVIAGGSTTLSIHAKREGVECSPGTFIFWDKCYLDTVEEQQFLPAALVLTRIVSLPDETKLCLDLGHKSIASENSLENRVQFLNAPNLKAISHSEEHMVVEAGEGHSWKVGDILYGLPTHICPTCALYNYATTIVNGEIAETWNIIARDRKITI
jgi:D-serine deaminase-like pyridoxal phosphate-dependent protein